MQVQLTFRQMDPTFEIEEQIFKEARRLERINPQKLKWCHVVIERSRRHGHGHGRGHGHGHGHGQSGRPYSVHVRLQGVLGYHVSGGEYDAHAAHENPHVAITSAFGAVHSQLRSDKHINEDAPRPGFWYVDSEAQS